MQMKIQQEITISQKYALMGTIVPKGQQNLLHVKRDRNALRVVRRILYVLLGLLIQSNRKLNALIAL